MDAQEQYFQKISRHKGGCTVKCKERAEKYRGPGTFWFCCTDALRQKLITEQSAMKPYMQRQEYIEPMRSR